MLELKHNPRFARSFRRFGRKVLMTLPVLVVLLSPQGPYTYIGAKPALATNTIPKLLNYQARITNASGVPVSDGNLNIWISVYNASSGGSCLYAMKGSCGTPSFKTVTVVDGVFSMLIGDMAAGDNEIPDTLFQNTSLYVGVTVASDTEMVPRKRITAAPYAVNADQLDGLDASSSGSTTPYVFSANTNGNLVITGDPQGTLAANAVLYVNPASASANEMLLAISNNGSNLFRIDKEGDITHTGSLLATAASSTAQFVFRGAASHTQNIFEVQDSLTNRMFTVSATATTIDGGGSLIVGTTSTLIVNSSGNLARINNVAYSWPSAQGTNSTVLTNDGAGNLSWVSAGGSTSLNQAYLNSTSTTEIYLTGSQGALTIADTFSGTGNIFEIQDRTNSAGDYSARYLTVSGTSTLINPAGSSSYFVGIGNSTPIFLLTVGTTPGFSPNGDIIGSFTRNGSSQNAMLLVETDSTANDAGIILATPTVGEDAAIFLDESDSWKLKFATGDTMGTDGGRTGSTQMTIDQNGRVGIGTTSPVGALNVLSAGTSTVPLLSLSSTTGATPTTYQWSPLTNERAAIITGAGGSNGYGDLVLGTNQAEAANNVLGYLTWGQPQFKTNPDGYSGLKASIGAMTTGSGGTSFGYGGSITFSTRGDNTTMPERMRIDHNGRVGIGNSAPANHLTVGSATSTFEVNAAGNLIKINNVVYSWPASQGGASTVLQNNGSGTLSWVTSPGGSTLQTAYDSSTGSTEIFLGSARGALTLADSFSSFGGNLFEIQDRTNGAGDYSRRYLTVSSTSTSINPSSSSTYSVGIGLQVSSPNAFVYINNPTSGGIHSGVKTLRLTTTDRSTVNAATILFDDSSGNGASQIGAQFLSHAGNGLSNLVFETTDNAGAFGTRMIVGATSTDITGNFSFDGSGTFGDASGTDSVSFSGSRIASNLTPTTDATFSLGDYNRRWKDLWLSGGSAHIAYDTSGTTSLNLGWEDAQGRRAKLYSSGQPIQITPTGGNAGIYVQANNNVNIGAASAITSVLAIQPNGTTTILFSLANSSGTVGWRAEANNQFGVVNATTGFIERGDTTSSLRVRTRGGNALTQTSGTETLLAVGTPFSPTSGTAVFNNMTVDPTVNQTGGAGGITRGMLINPTLTSAFDWRSLEIASNGGYAIYQSGTGTNYLAAKLGIGNAAPANALTVGTTSTFEVDVNGNLVKVNNVPYSWPASQGGASTVLTNDGSGSLTWTAGSSLTNLNQAYLSSSSTGAFAEISITPSLGAVTIADTFSGTGNIFEIQDRTNATGDYSQRYFTVSSTNTLIGGLTAAASSTHSITPNARIAGNLTPTTDATFSLGDYNRRWKDLWLSGGSANIAYDTSGTSTITLGFGTVLGGTTARITSLPSMPLQITNNVGLGLYMDTSGNVGLNQLPSGGQAFSVLGTVAATAFNAGSTTANGYKISGSQALNSLTGSSLVIASHGSWTSVLTQTAGVSRVIVSATSTLVAPYVSEPSYVFAVGSSSSTDSVVFANTRIGSNLTPTTDLGFDLGDYNRRWRELWLGGGSANIAYDQSGTTVFQLGWSDTEGRRAQIHTANQAFQLTAGNHAPGLYMDRLGRFAIGKASLTTPGGLGDAFLEIDSSSGTMPALALHAASNQLVNIFEAIDGSDVDVMIDRNGEFYSMNTSHFKVAPGDSDYAFELNSGPRTVQVRPRNTGSSALTISPVSGMGTDKNLLQFHLNDSTGVSTRFDRVGRLIFGATNTDPTSSALITVATSSAATLLIDVRDLTVAGEYTQRYLTVSTTGTRIYGDLVVSGTCTGCGAGATSLNSAYLASTNTTELFITPSQGALTVADTFSGTGNIFEIQDRTNAAGDYSQRYLTVSSTSTNLTYNGPIVSGQSALNLSVNGITTGIGLNVTSTTSGLSDGNLARFETDTAGVLSSGIVKIQAGGAYTSTANAALLDVRAFGTTGTATVVNIMSTNAGQTTTKLLNVAASGYTTGYTGDVVDFTGVSTTGASNLLHLTSANTSAGNALRIDATAVTTGGTLASLNMGAATTGNGLTVATTGAYTGVGLLQLTAGAMTTGVLQQLTSTTGMTTGSLLRGTTSTAGAIATNGIFSFNATGNYTSTSNLVGLLSVQANTTTAGTIANITGNALTTGQGLRIASTGVGMTTGSLLFVNSPTTGAVATNGIVSFQATADYTSTANIGLLTVLANSTTAGTIERIEGNALTTGTALSISSTGNTTTAGSSNFGTLLDISKTGTATASSFSGSIARVSYAPTFTSGTTNSGNVLLISRSLTTSGGGTQTITGAVARFTDASTPTVGPIVHRASVVEISQDYISATGTALSVRSFATAGGAAFIQGAFEPLTVSGYAPSPTYNLFQVQNTSAAGDGTDYTARYLTVSATGTTVANLTVTGTCTGCGSSLNLNQAYLNSTSTGAFAELYVTPSLGAFTVADTFSGTGNIFEIQDRTNATGDYSQRHFTVSSTATIIGAGVPSSNTRLNVSESGSNISIARFIQTSASGSNGVTIQTQTSGAGDSALHVLSGAGANSLLSIRNNGTIGMGINIPAASLDLRSFTAEPATNIFQVSNSLNTANYLTVSSTSTILTYNNNTTETAHTISATGLTTGYAQTINVNGAATLTTGGALSLVGPTGAASLAGGGGLLGITSTGNFTTTTNRGGLLRIDASGMTAATVASITDTSVMTSNGRLLSLIANGATTVSQLVAISATGLTTGTAFSITGGLSAAATAALSGNLASISYAPVFTTTTTINTGSMLNVSRNISVTGASTQTISGTVASFTDGITQTAGTVNHGGAVVYVKQGFTGATNSALVVGSSAAVAPAIYATGLFTPLVVAGGTTNPPTNLFEIQNSSDGFNGSGTGTKAYTTKYFTVSSTSTQVLGDLVITGTCTGCGAGATSLNSAYLASTNTAEISLSPSIGALTVADTFSGTGNIFEIQDRLSGTSGEYGTRYLTVSSTSTNLTYNADTTQTAMDLTVNGLTSGTGLSIDSTATGFTGNLASLALTGDNAGNTGTLLNINSSGASSTAKALKVAIASTGNLGTGGGNGGVNFGCSGAARTGNCFQIDDNSTASGASALAINLTGITTGTGYGLSIVANGMTSSAGNAMNISSTGAYTGSAGLMRIEASNAGATGALLTLSTATTGSVNNNGIASFNASGAYTSSASSIGLVSLNANSTTSGVVEAITANALTSGTALGISTTGVYTGAAGVFNLTANSATTGNIGVINATGLTSGSALAINGSGATMLAGGSLINAGMGAATTGSALAITNSGAYTGANGILRINTTATTQTGPSLLVATASTGTITNGLVRFNFTGSHLGNGFQIDDTSPGNGGTAMAVNVGGGQSNGLVVANTNTACSTCNLLRLTKSGGTGGTAMTGNLAEIVYTQTFNAGPSVENSGSMLNVSRVFTENLLSGAPYITGAVAKFSDATTLTTGTVRHGASVVDIRQLYVNATGTALTVVSSATGGSAGYFNGMYEPLVVAGNNPSPLNTLFAVQNTTGGGGTGYTTRYLTVSSTSTIITSPSGSNATLRLQKTGGTNIWDLLNNGSNFFLSDTLNGRDVLVGYNAGGVGLMPEHVGTVGIGTAPDFSTVLIIGAETDSPTKNIFEIRNQSGTSDDYTTKYFTVSSTSTQVLGDLVITGTCTGCGAGATSLNSAYLASTNTTELFITPSLGALSIADTFSGTGNIFEIQDRTNDAGDYSRRYLTVSSTSTSISYPTTAPTGAMVGLTATGAYTSSASTTALLGLTANSTVSGVVQAITANALTTGTAFGISSSGVYTGAAGLLNLNATGATTGNVARINATGLTSGNALTIVGSGATMAAGSSLLNLDMGAATLGAGLTLTTTGNYTGTGLLNVNMASATGGTGNGLTITSGLTGGTGNALLVTGSGGFTTPNGLVRINTTAGGQTGASLLVSAASTGAVSNGLVRFQFTGAHTNTGFQLDDSTTAGTAMTVNANSITTGAGSGLVVNANGMTSSTGNALRVSSTGAYTGANGLLQVSSANAAVTGPLLNTTSNSTGAFANGGVRFQFTGAHTGNGVQIDDVTAGGNVLDINANSLTNGNALNVTTTNNTAAVTAWSANKFNITSAQATTASNDIVGIDVQFTQSATIAANTEAIMRLALAESSNTDASFARGLIIQNDDTATNGQVTMTDGIKITGSNITNALNLTGVFGSMLIDSNNFDVTQNGAVTMGASLDAVTTDFDLLTTTTTGTVNFASVAGTLNMAGGSGSTGCTLDGTTGNLTCTGTITGSGGGTNLNQAYANSSATGSEIYLDSSRGALTIADSFSSFGGNLFEIQDRTNAAGDYSRRYLTVSSTSTIVSDGSVIMPAAGGGLTGAGVPALAGGLPGTAYVNHGTNNWGLVISRAHPSDYEGGALTFYKTRSTNTSTRTAVDAGEILGLISFQGASTASETLKGAQIYALTTSVPSAGVMPTEIRLATSLTNVPTNRFAIASTGAARMGDTTSVSVENNVDVFTIGNTGTGQTSDQKSLVNLAHTGSYDTTAAALNEFGLSVTMSATKSAGANTLTDIAISALANASTTANNIAFYANALNGSANYSFYGVAGTIYNAGDLTIDGNTMLGNASSTDSVSFTGARISSNLTPTCDPSACAGFSLGDYDRRWKDLWLSGGSANIAYDRSGTSIMRLGWDNSSATATAKISIGTGLLFQLTNSVGPGLTISEQGNFGLGSTNTSEFLTIGSGRDIFLEDKNNIITPYVGFGVFMNPLRSSSDFGSGAWVKLGSMVVTNDTAVAPDDTVSADTLAGSASLASVRGTSTGFSMGSSPLPVTFSVWLKSTGATDVPVELRIDGSLSGTGVTKTVSVQPYWQRFYVTQNASGNPSPHIIVNFQTVYAWGGQMEKGSGMGPYLGSRTDTAIGTPQQEPVRGIAFSSDQGGIYFGGKGNTAHFSMPPMITMDHDNGTADTVDPSRMVLAAGTSATSTGMAYESSSSTFSFKGNFLESSKMFDIALGSGILSYGDTTLGNDTSSDNVFIELGGNATTPMTIDVGGVTSSQGVTITANAATTGAGLKINATGITSGGALTIDAGADSAGTHNAIRINNGADQFTVSATGTIRTNSNIILGNGSAADDDAIYFDQSAESLTWVNSTTWFDFSDDVEIDMNGTATANGVCHSNPNVAAAPGTNRQLVVCSGAPTDVAEMYPTVGVPSAGDILVATDATFTYETDQLNPLTGESAGYKASQTTSVLDKSSTPYAQRIIGVVSTSPAVNYGRDILNSTSNTAPVALVGRVPTKVSIENGPIAVGDPITTSSVRGVGMKSTKPGMIVGYALDAWNGPGQGAIQVYVQPVWHSGLTITTDGAKSLFNDDFTFDATETASATGTSFGSFALNFRGSTWNGASNTAVTRNISVLNETSDISDYQLAFRNDDSALLATLNQAGDLALAGSLTVNGGFDYAEMFPAVPDIEAGDIVMVDPSGESDYGVKKTQTAYENSAIGVISTKPGFLTGKKEENTQPVALAGRVPVKVNMESGAINPGDPITSSSAPGVGMKATEAGRVIGIALQGATENGTTLIFVNPSWWNGPTPAAGANAGSSLSIQQGSLLDFKNSVLSNVAAIISTNGLWGITSDGQLVAQKVEAKTIQYEDAVLVQSETKASAAEGVVPAGYDAVVVHNPAMKANSKVFITFMDDAGGNSWVKEKGEGNFTLHLAKPAMNDLPFEYWILGIDDRRPTVSDGTPEATPPPAGPDPTLSGSTTPETDPTETGTSTPQTTE